MQGEFSMTGDDNNRKKQRSKFGEPEQMVPEVAFAPAVPAAAELFNA